MSARLWIVDHGPGGAAVPEISAGISQSVGCSQLTVLLLEHRFEFDIGHIIGRSQEALLLHRFQQPYCVF